MRQRPKISAYLRIIPTPERVDAYTLNPRTAALYDIVKISSSQFTVPFVARGRSARSVSASSSSYGIVATKKVRSGATFEDEEGRRPLLSCQAVVGPDETEDWIYGDIIDWYLSLLYNGEDINILAFSGTALGDQLCRLPEPIRFFFCNSSSLELCFIAQLLRGLSSRGSDTLFTISCQVQGYRGENDVVCLMPQQYVTPSALLRVYCGLLLEVGCTIPTISTFNITVCDNSGSFTVSSTLKLAIIPLVGNDAVITSKPLLEEAVPGRGQFPKDSNLNYSLGSAASTKQTYGVPAREPTLAQRIKERKCSCAEKLGDIQVLDCSGIAPGRNTVELPCSISHTCTNCTQTMAAVSSAFSAAYNRDVPLMKVAFLRDLIDTFTGRVCTCVIGFVFQNAGRDIWTRRIIDTIARVAFVAQRNNWSGPTTAKKMVTIDADQLEMLKKTAERAQFLETELQSLRRESQKYTSASRLDLAVLKTQMGALASQEAILRAERAYLSNQSKLLITQLNTYEELKKNVISHCHCGKACNSLSNCGCGCSKERACSNSAHVASLSY